MHIKGLIVSDRRGTSFMVEICFTPLHKEMQMKDNQVHEVLHT